MAPSTNTTDDLYSSSSSSHTIIADPPSASDNFYSPSRPDLINLKDWLAAQDAAELASAATDDGSGSGIQPSARNAKKRGFSMLEPTAVVTRRPTTNRSVDLDETASAHANGQQEQAGVMVDLEERNWVGLLHEYYQAHPKFLPSGAPAETTYQEASPSLSRFTCSVLLPEPPGLRFGGTKPFTRKKDAKQHAAKCAVEWLIENRYMPPIGQGVVWPKRGRPGTPSDEESGGPDAGPASVGQQVAALCTRLGMPPPTYKIEPSKEFGGMCSGYAMFDYGTIGVEGKVGEFTNVFGKKRAKEECARKVLEVLKGVESGRRARSNE